MTLGFDVASCVHASSKFASCVKCVDACPTQTLIFSNNLPAFVPSDCIDCGGCVGTCPTEAFSLRDFSPATFVFDFLKKDQQILSCGTNVPCLAALNVEYLISMGSCIDISLDISKCKSCDIATTLFPIIEKRVDEANYILDSFGFQKLTLVDVNIEINEPSQGTNRRDFFRNFSIDGALRQKEVFKNALSQLETFVIDAKTIEKIKLKPLPNHRKLLLVSLSQHQLSPHYETLDGDEVNCYSQKYVDENCTNCQMCYRLCPTGALSTDSHASVIKFDASICVKCHLCHDVCQPNAIHMQKALQTEVLAKSSKRILAQFDIKRCSECSTIFSSPCDVDLCPRCQIEEEEAFALQNYTKDGDGAL